MIEGLWIVQYEGLQGNGGGVAVFINGRVLGGDTGYTYEGTYDLRGDTLTALVHVSNFLPNIPNVLGVIGDFDLQIQAPLRGGVIQGAMSLVGRPGISVAVRLTKKSAL
jgi:T3SS negative regulator,GrlR